MKNPVFTKVEMVRRYGSFMAKGANLNLNPEEVPEELRGLIHYASFWGWSDDLEREDLVEAAPDDILMNLQEVVAHHDDALDEWLAGAEAHRDPPTREYVAFTDLRMAADFA